MRGAKSFGDAKLEPRWAALQGAYPNRPSRAESLILPHRECVGPTAEHTRSVSGRCIFLWDDKYRPASAAVEPLVQSPHPIGSLGHFARLLDLSSNVSGPLDACVIGQPSQPQQRRFQHVQVIPLPARPDIPASAMEADTRSRLCLIQYACFDLTFVLCARHDHRDAYGATSSMYGA